MKKQAVLSLSGGMDSSSLLLHLLANGYEVTALSFDYGQKHNVELERAKELVNYINSDCTVSSFVRHQVIKLDGLAQLLNSSLVTGGSEVPEGHYAEENMKATVVPNRNKIFSSIIQAVALSIAEQNNTECVIAMGIHAGDHAIYPDCRQEFRDIDYEAFKAGNWGAEKVTYYTP
jgi:7-cyano-7-deazaguanine synthase